MKRRIEIAITSTGKPSVRMELECTGEESLDEVESSRTLAWESAMIDYERMKREYLKMCTELK